MPWQAPNISPPCISQPVIGKSSLMMMLRTNPHSVSGMAFIVGELCRSEWATRQRRFQGWWRVLHGLHYKMLFIYLDDIVTFSDAIDSQIHRLQIVFDRLRAANLKLKPQTCELFQESVLYLGHTLSKDGIHTNPKKIEKVKNVPIPQSLRQVRSFIGLASYYRKFIQDFATIAKPLHDLMRKYVRFKWTAECTRAFERLKTCLITAPILALPRAKGQYVLNTLFYNRSRMAKKRKVIAYASKAISHAEQQYCTTRRELLAIVVFLEHFRHYLYGQPLCVTVSTDHGSLKWLWTSKHQLGNSLDGMSKLRSTT